MESDMTTPNGANPPVHGDGEPQETDWKAKYEELNARAAASDKERESLQSQYKNLQRQLNKAQRGGDTAVQRDLESVRSLLGELTTAVAPLLGDETAQAALRSRVAATTNRSAAQRVAQETYDTMVEMAEAAGVEDFDAWWDSTDAAATRKAWQEGDVRRVVGEAGKALVRRGTKPSETVVPPPETPTPEPKPTPPKLDSGAAGARSGRKLADLSKVDVNKLSRTELAAHQEEIYAAWERESGIKFKR